MAKEKELTVNETTGEVVEVSALNAFSSANGSVAEDSELDFAFRVEQEPNAPEGEVAVSTSEWKFPGLRVTRNQFVNKDGKKMYSYAAHLNLKLSNGQVYQLTCELRSSDQKNARNYEKLDMIWSMLPKEQDYMFLGFQYVDYTRSYNLCVQIEDNGIPIRVSLTPRDAKSRDDLGSMISFLKQHNKL